MRQSRTNRDEWKEFCKIDRSKAYYWYNKVTKKRISKEFESLENCDKDAKVIHHLRDTEEQRKYNDAHYEMFGMNLDGTFEYGKYVVFWTKEHHNEYHHCSEETRKKRGKSLKGIPRTDEWRKKLSESNKGKIIPDEQRRQISISVSNLWKSEDFRERHSKATKEAMRRPEVKQKLLDWCKKRPPQSKESRQKAGEANKVKNISDEDICEFIKYFKSVVHISKPVSIKGLSRIFCLYKECYHTSWNWNKFQRLYKITKHTLLQMETT